MAILDDDIRIRAYYLSEDDGKLNRHRLSNQEYYYLAENITKFMKEYYFFDDHVDTNYSACSLCFEHYAKVNCVSCKQTVCVQCMLKTDTCPFCRNIKKKKHYLKKYNTTIV